jgi:NAD+ diphosphatase
LIFLRNHLYCGACGFPTEPKEGGMKRNCTNVPPETGTPATNTKFCGKVVYPRTDPVVIMLLIHKDRCLLGRKKEWPSGVWSCLAGFLDVGESIEEAVKREVKEEIDVDIDVNAVTYHSSQPWPYLGLILLSQ